MWFGIVSLFPSTFKTLEAGVTGRAMKDGVITIQHWNPRDFATDKHKTIDDRPYGGGPGMVMMVEPMQAAIKAAKTAAPAKPLTIYVSPQGRVFDQAAAEKLISNEAVVFVAGRYEGIDERLLELEIDEEWSIGDYILTGGELPAMVMIDAATRLIPGVLGDDESAAQDSLTTGLLKYPQYTRPEHALNRPVPEVLLSGNHREICRWRLKQSLGKTWLRRPDILAKKELSKEEKALLAEFMKENSLK